MYSIVQGMVCNSSNNRSSRCARREVGRRGGGEAGRRGGGQAGRRGGGEAERRRGGDGERGKVGRDGNGMWVHQGVVAKVYSSKIYHKYTVAPPGE